MYRVGDKVKYRCPMKLETEGKILAKFKVLEDLYGNTDAVVYLINYDVRCNDDFVFEENIIEKIKQ